MYYLNLSMQKCDREAYLWSSLLKLFLHRFHLWLIAYRVADKLLFEYIFDKYINSHGAGKGQARHVRISKPSTRKFLLRRTFITEYAPNTPCVHYQICFRVTLARQIWICKAVHYEVSIGMVCKNMYTSSMQSSQHEFMQHAGKKVQNVTNCHIEIMLAGEAQVSLAVMMEAASTWHM